MRSTFTTLFAGLLSTLLIVSCGPSAPMEHADDAITGGSYVGPALYPWMVALYRERESPWWQRDCGGVLIDATHILTSAFCAVDYPDHSQGRFYTVLPARPDTIRALIRPTSAKWWHNPTIDGNMARIKSVFVHPDYDDVTKDFSVAILELSQPVVMNNYPTLANANQTSQWIASGVLVRALGYGFRADFGSVPDDGVTGDEAFGTPLSQVTMPLISNSQCAAQSLRLGPGWLTTITSNQMCTAAGERDTCYNDEGGPIFRTIRGQPVLVGIAGSNSACGAQGFVESGRVPIPGAHLRVSAVLDYIRSCQAGSCATLTRRQRTCYYGYGDCDGDLRNGCEHVIDSDTECGGCGAPACGPGEQCTEGPDLDIPVCEPL